MNKLGITIFATLILGPIEYTTPSWSKSGVKVGALECRIKPGIGFVIGSTKELRCKFNPSLGRPEYYGGSIDKLGLDIGYTGPAHLAWVVFAPGSVKVGALSGTYGGASASASVGLGLGANVLVGGFNKSISLQPLSIQGQSGLNLAIGVSRLRLYSR